MVLTTKHAATVLVTLGYLSLCSTIRAQQCGNATRTDKYFYLEVSASACNAYRPGDVTLRNTAAGFPGEATDCILVNNSLPGPALRVTKGDWVRIDVQNLLYGRTVAIHIHGLHVEGTPWADGTAHVNACPIQPATTRTVIFQANHAGTYLYHGHAGTEENFGVSGAFIVEDPHDPNMGLYDAEPTFSTLFIRDWWTASEGHSGQPNAFHHFQQFYPYGVPLVNGLYGNDKLSPTGRPLPLPVFDLAMDTCYRLRIIEADTDSTGWSINFTDSATGAPLNVTVIAHSARNNRPTNTLSVTVYTKQRADVVFCTAPVPTNYTVTMKVADPQNVTFSTVTCPQDPNCIETMSFTLRAAAQFNGTKQADRAALAAAPYTASFDPLRFPSIIEQTGYENDTLPPYFAVSQTWMLYLGAAPGGHEFMWTDRMFQLQLPDVPPLFTGGAQCGVSPPPPPGFTPTNPSNAKFHLAKSVRNGEVVDIVFNNISPWSHPIHLHGHSQWVLGSRYRGPSGYAATPDTVCPGGQHTWSVPSQDGIQFPPWPRLTPPRNATPFFPFIFGCTYGLDPADDTFMLPQPYATDIVQVPAHSWAIVRVRFDNPGVWQYHCHQNSHMREGMGFLVYAGMDRLPKIPSWVDTACVGTCQTRNQVCGNYTPPRSMTSRCTQPDRTVGVGACQPFPPAPTHQ